MNKLYRTTVYMGTKINERGEKVKVRKTINAKTKKELAELKKYYKSEAEKNKINERKVYSEITYGQWAEEYIQVKIDYRNIKRASKEDVKFAIKHSVSYFGDKKIREIKNRDIQLFINDLYTGNTYTNNKVNPNYIRKIITNMKNIYAYAEVNEDPSVRMNVFAGLNIPRANSSTRRALSEQEQYMIIEFKHMCQCPAMIMLFTGMRREEALGLRWCDINWDKRMIRTENTMSLKYDRGLVKGGKTKAFYRTIPIPPILYDYLLQKKQQVKPKDIDIICLTAKGVPYTGDSWNRMWANYYANLNYKYGYGKDVEEEPISLNEMKKLPLKIGYFTPHFLRHTWRRILYLQNINLQDAKEILGHASINVTSDIYTDDSELRKDNISEEYKKHLQTDFKIAL